MLIGGEKWACEACVRGHRVSNCQHSDRPLQHINKKGRPVSQCQHCRTLRKSRSAHVRCDCSLEKIQSKETLTAAAIVAASSNGDSFEANTHAKNCSCNHGAGCKCALKKEPLEPVPESDSDEPPVMVKRRARAHTTSFENGITILTNGHRKQSQKHNNTAQKYGSPYPMSRTQSLRVPSPTSISKTLEKTAYMTTVKPRHEDSPIKEVIEQRLVKSEHASPVLSSASSLDLLNGQLPSLSMFVPGDVNWPQGLNSISSATETEQPMFSAGIGPSSIDWSHYDRLTFNSESFVSSNFSQPTSYSGFEFGSLEQPTLTTAPTSGEISEVDDFAPLNDKTSGIPSIFPHTKYTSDQDTPDFIDVEDYGISTTSPYMSLSSSQVLANSNIEDLEVFLKCSNTLNSCSHGLLTPTDDQSRASQDSSPFTESHFALPLPEEENELLWMSNFPQIQANVGTGPASSNLSDDFWAQ